MASITDNLKDGLKYPLYEPKKIGLLAALYCIIFALFFASLYVFIGSLKQAINVHMLVEGSKMLPTVLSSSSIAEISIFLIISVIVSLFITGYLYEIIKFTIEGKNTLPEFNEFVDMLVTGIKLVIVGIVYSIIHHFLHHRIVYIRWRICRHWNNPERSGGRQGVDYRVRVHGYCSHFADDSRPCRAQLLYICGL